MMMITTIEIEELSLKINLINNLVRHNNDWLCMSIDINIFSVITYTFKKNVYLCIIPSYLEFNVGQVNRLRIDLYLKFPPVRSRISDITRCPSGICDAFRVLAAKVHVWSDDAFGKKGFFAKKISHIKVYSTGTIKLLQIQNASESTKIATLL